MIPWSNRGELHFITHAQQLQFDQLSNVMWVSFFAAFIGVVLIKRANNPKWLFNSRH